MAGSNDSLGQISVLKVDADAWENERIDVVTKRSHY